jgi:hypothetical protein
MICDCSSDARIFCCKSLKTQTSLSLLTCKIAGMRQWGSAARAVQKSLILGGSKCTMEFP